MGAKQTASDSAGRCGRLCRRLAVAGLVLLLPGCGELAWVALAFWIATDYCEVPGHCGESGTLLANFGLGISEVGHPYGRIPDFPDPVDGQRGFVFTDDPNMRMFVASDTGLREYDGRVYESLFNIITVPDCSSMEDVVLMPDGTLVVSCPDAGRLVKIDPATSSVIDSFQCCEEVDPRFEPRAIALAPDGRLLAGKRWIYAFDGTTGESLGIIIPAGVGRSGWYDDMLFSPEGNLLVCAYPDVGVLEFDGETFEFLGVLIPGGTEGVPYPKALAFDEEGHLFVGSGVTGFIAEFDAQSGELVRVVLDDYSISTVDHLGFRP